MSSTNPEPPTRDRVFGLKVSTPEHALLHAAARAEEADSASAWARGVLLDAARERFRAAIRRASASRGAGPTKRVEA